MRRSESSGAVMWRWVRLSLTGPRPFAVWPVWHAGRGRLGVRGAGRAQKKKSAQRLGVGSCAREAAEGSAQVRCSGGRGAGGEGEAAPGSCWLGDRRQPGSADADGIYISTDCIVTGRLAGRSDGAARQDASHPELRTSVAAAMSVACFGLAASCLRHAESRRQRLCAGRASASTATPPCALRGQSSAHAQAAVVPLAATLDSPPARLIPARLSMFRD